MVWGRPTDMSGKRTAGCLLMTLAAVVGWFVTAVACVPLAWYLGIWLSGWEKPEGFIQGASTNPLYGGAGPMMLLSFLALLAVSSILWGRLIRRIVTRHKHYS